MKFARPLMAFLIGLSLSVAAPAAETPLEQMKDQLERMRKHLSAVSARFKGGMKFARPSTNPDQPSTPALECCEANLRAARDRLAGFDQALLKLAACYRQLGNSEGLTQVRLIRTDAESLLRGLQVFVKTRSHAEARGALAGTTRAFLLLDKDVRALVACELPQETPLTEPEYPTSDPSGL